MYFKPLFIVIVSLAPFLFTLQGYFVFDDSEAILKNKDVTSGSWLDSFRDDFWGTSITSNHSHKSYRPLTILTFRLNYVLNNQELSATQFKVTNLICHAVCCILLWKSYNCIWAKVKRKNEENNAVDVPFLASLLFSVHPVHVEAASGIVGRADLLAAMTFLLSFLIYDISMKNKNVFNIYLFMAVILAGLSMLFKENGVTIMGVCCIYDAILHFRMRKLKRLKNKTDILKSIHVDVKCIYRVTIMTLFAIFFLYARWAVMAGTTPEFKPSDNPAAFSDNLFTKIATYNYIYFLNIVLLIWPQWLCYDWSMGSIPLINNALDFRILFIFVMYLYIFLFVKAVSSRKYERSRKGILLAASLMIIPFLPATNIIYPVGFVIAERILYIPSIGYCLLIAIGFEKILQRKRQFQKIAIGIFFCIVLIYAIKSWRRAYDWQSEYNLFTSALSVCPLNAKVHYNVAKVADAKQNSSWAMDEYKEALRLYPEYYQAMNNLANLLKNKKYYSEAESYLRKAIYYKKDFPAAWMNLGIVLANTGRYHESQSAYKTALRYRKNYPDCFYNLGNLYLEMNRTDKAVENWYQAINSNPKHVSAWTNLLALLDNTGQIEKALQIIPKALAELPDSASIYFAIANIYGKHEQYTTAEKYFLQAISLFKERVQAIHYANLGVLYHRWKKIDLANQMYKMALEIDPKFPSAIKNLQNLKKLKIKI
ncbi:protein O-mannosyl-transferase TMTC4-like [Maniola hyperantus]|uniref:protein O-mannosyl-transferase TMTC4-like n=1 Tax=Aphantopus hyperantus TaxID=2795564 RepID=UPI001569B741|nr:protein O-mannosyl-transferase TMTC4-like [Maniola hyperantus]